MANDKDLDKMLNDDGLDELDKLFEDESIDIDSGLEGDSRDPVDKVLKSTKSAMKDYDLKSKLLERVKDDVIDTLPNDLRNVVTGIDNEIYGLKREIEDKLPDVKKTLKSMLGDAEELAPNKVLGINIKDKIRRLKDKIHVEEETFIPEETLDEKAKRFSDEILGGDIQKSILSDIDVKTNVNLNLELLKEAKTTNNFLLKLSSKYYKNSLELMFKQLHALVSIDEKTKLLVETLPKQLEGILRNTSIPDVMKYRGNELLKENLRRDMMESGIELIKNSQSVRTITSKLKKAALSGFNKGLEGLRTGQEFISTQREMKELMSDVGMDPTQMAIQSGFDFALGTVMTGLKKGVRKVASKSRVANKLHYKLDKTISNPEKVLEKWENKLNDKNNPLAESMAEFISSLRKEMGSSKTDIDLSRDVNQPTVFDIKTKLAITNIIPTYLSKILAEVTGIRLKLKAPKVDEIVFDYKRNRFFTAKQLKNKFIRDSKKASKYVLKTIEEESPKIISILEKDTKLNEEEKKQVTSALLKHVNEGGSKDIRFLKDEGFLDKLDEGLKNKLTPVLDKISKDYTSVDLKEVEEAKEALNRIERSLANEAKEFGERAKELADIGRTDILETLKIINDDHTKISGERVFDIVTDLTNRDISKNKIKYADYIRTRNEDAEDSDKEYIEDKINKKFNEFKNIALPKIDDIKKETKEIIKHPDKKLNIVKNELTKTVEKIKNTNRPKIENITKPVGTALNKAQTKAEEVVKPLVIKIESFEKPNLMKEKLISKINDVKKLEYKELKSGAVKTYNNISSKLVKSIEKFESKLPSNPDQELKQNVNKLEHIIQNDQLDNLLEVQLAQKPLPKDIHEAKIIYEETVHSLDPTGRLKEELSKKGNWIERLYNIHKGVMAKIQAGVFNLKEKMSELFSGDTFSNLKDRLGLAGKLGSRGLKILGAGKDWLVKHGQLLKDNTSELLYDPETGKFKRPTIKGLAKFGYKTFMGSAKITGETTKETYGQMFGVLKDIKDSLVKNTEKNEKIVKVLNKTVTLDKNKTNTNTASKFASMLKSTVKKQSSILKGIKDKVTSNKKETQVNPFDKDGDGDRDGNWKDRLALFKKKNKNVNPLEKRLMPAVDKKEDLLSTLLKWGPFLIGGLITGFKKILGGVTDSLITGFKHVLWEPIKWLGNTIMSGIGKALGSITGLISKIPGLGTVIEKGKDLFKSAKDKVKDLFTKGKTPDIKDKIKPKTALPKKPVKVKPSSIKSVLSRMKNLVVKKLGKKAGAKLLAKIATRFVPFVGTAMLAYDAVKVGYYMMHDGLSLPAAVSKQLLGFSIFDDNEPAIDPETGEPIKPDVENKDSEKTKTTEANIETKQEHPSTVSNWKKETFHQVPNQKSKPPKIKNYHIGDTLKEIKIPIGNKEELVAKLVKHEGLKLRKYRDSLGYETIGVGHLLDTRKGGVPLRDIIDRDTDQITEPEAFKILAYDTNKTGKKLYSLLPWLRNQPEIVQEDLIDMGFNLGVGGLLKFKDTLNAIKEGDYSKAANNLMRSKWYKQVGDRAKEIVNDFMSLSQSAISTSSTMATTVRNTRSQAETYVNTINKQQNEIVKETAKQAKAPIANVDYTPHFENSTQQQSITNNLLKESLNIQKQMLNTLQGIYEISKATLMLQHPDKKTVKAITKKEKERRYIEPPTNPALSVNVNEF